MLVLEIILVGIGLAAVILSFRISDSSKISSNAALEEEGKQFLEEKKQELTSLGEEYTNAQRNAIEQAKEDWNSFSNEKIMGINEYSSQVLDKIEKNHAEVVFLYNMLNEKEEELKQTVHQIDVIKAQLHDDIVSEYQKAKEEMRKEAQNQSRMVQQPVRTEMTDIYDEEIARIIEAEQAASGDTKELSSVSDEEELQNHNREIIRLYQKGNSVLEISRLLSLGQGEVKFVIDLYQQSSGGLS